MKLHDIIERRAAVEAELRKLYDDAEAAGQDLTGDALARWNALKTERDELRVKEERARTRDDLDRAAEGRPLEQLGLDDGETVFGLKPEQRMAQYLARTTGQQEQRLSAGKAIRGMLTGEWSGAEAEQRAMGTSPGATGGFLMPAPISANIIDLARNQAVLIRAGALTIPMPAKNLRVVKIATDPTATWRGEGDEITESDGTFEAVNLTAHSLAALVRVNAELLDDVPMFAATLDNMLAAALALELDRVGLYGTGAGQPLGLRNDPYVNEIEMDTNGAAPANYDKWLDAMQAVEDDNGVPEVTIQSPRTKYKLAKLVTGITSDMTKLEPPREYAALRLLTSNQVSVAETQGSSSDASTDFFGGFQNCAFAIRQNVTIEASRQSSDVFTKNQVHVRAIMRADFVAFRGNQLCRLVGIR